MLAARAHTWPLKNNELVLAWVPPSFLQDSRTRLANPPTAVARWLSNIHRHARNVHVTWPCHGGLITQSRSLDAEASSRDSLSVTDINVLPNHPLVASPSLEGSIGSSGVSRMTLAQVGGAFDGQPKPFNYKHSLPEGMRSPASVSAMSFSSGHRHRSRSPNGTSTPTRPASANTGRLPGSNLAKSSLVIGEEYPGTAVVSVPTVHQEQDASEDDTRSVAVQTGTDSSSEMEETADVAGIPDEGLLNSKRKRSDSTSSDQANTRPSHKRHQSEPPTTKTMAETSNDHT